MKAKKRIAAVAVLIVAAAIVFGCGGTAALTDPSGAPLTVYLKNNIHYQERPDRSGNPVSRASYANYTDPGEGHHFLAVNTPVTIGNWRRGFTIMRVSDGKVVHFEYNKKNVALDVKSYLDLITSPVPVSMAGLSGIDLRGIKEGRAHKGMSRKGVRMALGYPAPHRTPSLEDSVWTYWKNRWDTRTVEFNSKGKVIKVQ